MTAAAQRTETMVHLVLELLHGLPAQRHRLMTVSVSDRRHLHGAVVVAIRPGELAPRHLAMACLPPLQAHQMIHGAPDTLLVLTMHRRRELP